MIGRLDRGLHAVYRACGALAGAFIALIGILVLINIGSRVVGAFVPGMTEGAGYCMAAAGALGLAYTFGEHGHIRVTMLVQRLRDRTRFVVEWATLAAAAGLAGFAAFYLGRMVWVSYLFEERSDGSDELPIWLPQLPMAAGFIVFAIALLHAVFAGLAQGRIAAAEDNRSAPDSGAER